METVDISINKPAPTGSEVPRTVSVFRVPVSKAVVTSVISTLPLPSFVSATPISPTKKSSPNSNDNYITSQLMKFVNKGVGKSSFQEYAIKALVRRLRRGQDRGTVVSFVQSRE